MDDPPRTSRLDGVPFSPVRRIVEAAATMERNGRHVLHMELGRPDFDTPAAIKAAAVQALDEGRVHYTSNYGTPELSEAIARRLDRAGLSYEPGREIIPTAGVGEGVFSTLLALLEPGDEVVVVEPAWHHYGAVARLAGAGVRTVPTTAAGGFLPDPEQVAARIGPRTRMLVLNSPNNPTGVLYPEDLLVRLGEIARRHDLIIVSDEIYDGLVYEGTHRSVAALQDHWNRTVLLNGFSKTYSMTGWRVGYVAAPAALADRIIRVHQHNTVCPASFAQYGAAAAYQGAAADEVEAMRRAFDARRREACGILRAIPGVQLVEPASAFYLFPRFPGFGADLADRLLEEAAIACVPGAAFGRAYDDHLRLSFACSSEVMREALARLAAVVAA